MLSMMGPSSDRCRAASAAGSTVRSCSIACAAERPSMMIRSVGPRVSSACQECRGVSLQRTSTPVGVADVPWSQASCRGRASVPAASRPVAPGGRVPAAVRQLPRCPRVWRVLAGTLRRGRFGFFTFFMTLLPPSPHTRDAREDWLPEALALTPSPRAACEGSGWLNQARGGLARMEGGVPR
jgi:hypothetical protein